VIVFAEPLPRTPRATLSGLADTVVVRAVDQGRGPGITCWREGAPGSARAGDHVLLEAGSGDVQALRQRALRVWWRCRTPAQVRSAAQAGVGAWLIGAEAGGRVGRATALTLIRQAAQHPGLAWVAAGLTRGARAASLAVGAAGIVLDAVIWGARGSPLHPSRRARLAGLGVRESRLLGDHDGVGLRVLAPREQLDALVERIDRQGPEAVQAELHGWWARESGPALVPVSVGELGAEPLAASELVARERRAMAEHLQQVRAHHPLRSGLDPLGTGVPIVQGPMANVAERPDLARAVRSAGALPFVALGALRPAEARAVLDGVRDVEPCGAGLIAFDVAPHRQDHVQALIERGPRPVILAGGSPALARRLAADGLEPWLHTPSPRLAGLAVGSGVPAVVLEGHEAGGHVGPVPGSALWDRALQAIGARMDPDRPPLVVLAGGIGDAVSAAFAAALAAPASARGIRVVLQAGTAFFFTREIRRAGQLSEAGQQVALQVDRTVLVGESANLPLRCAPNPYATETVHQERAWREAGLSLRERRQRLEQRNLGRTRVAAKGIERDPDWDGADPSQRHRAVPEDRVRTEGAHTLGQGATVTRALTTVAELVHELTAGARAVLKRRARWGAARPVAGEPSPARRGPEIRVPLGRIRGGASPAPGPAERGPAHDSIAIVGLGCVLPGAPDLLGWWRAQMRGVDAIAPIPTDRWDARRYTSPGSGASGPAHAGSVAAAVAADPPFDALRYRIPPRVLPTVERAQRLALLAGDEALVDAGLSDSSFDPARAAVILGNAMGGEWRSKMAVRVRFREVMDQLVGEGALDGAELATLETAVEARLDEELVPLRPESIVGLLGNLSASRLAAWLDWQGGSHTVDAACAASLLAVVHAVDALRAGRIDVALSGGVDTDLSIDTYVGFSRTQALSSAGSRPFSRLADGFVMGEGAAAFALVRLQDAVTRGWPVWAVIQGVGTASDGRARGLTAPRPQGQRLAIERAWADAGQDPSAAAYVEAHGTGTVLGDRTEATVLAEVFGQPWVGTAKGAIGHLKSGAGAAGLLRAALAVATGIVPPTAHVGPPIQAAPDLRLARRATAPPGGLPLAGVSAFGFGGTNAHLVLAAPPAGVRRPELVERLRTSAQPFLAPVEQARWTPAAPPSPSRLTPSPRVHLFAGADRTELARAVQTGRPAALSPEGPLRLALVHDPLQPPPDRAALAHALRQGDPLPGAGRTTFLDDRRRPVVVVVPGQGAQRPGALASVSRFARAEVLLPALRQALGGELHAPEHPDTRALHRHLFAVSSLWALVLRQSGVPIHGALGHSLGELAALVAAGCATPQALAPVVRARGQALHAAPPGAMLAVLGPADAAARLARESGVHVAARNGPQATVLSGAQLDIERAREQARSAGLRAVPLAVAHAFHSPQVAPAAGALAQAVQGLELDDGPWWSATGSDAPPAQALVDAITHPVDFAPTLDRRAPAHALVVELGPGRSLSPHARALGRRAIALDPAPDTDPHGPVRAAAALWTAGHPGLLDHLPGVDLRLASQRRPVGPAAYRTHQATPPQPPITAVSDAPPADASEPGAAPPADATAADPVSTRQAVLDALAQVTGYDEAVLDQAADLQADLGVDSIQRLEVVGLLQERLELHLSDADQDALEHADLDALVERIDARRSDPPAPSVRSAPTGSSRSTPSTGPSEPTLAWLHRARWIALDPGTRPIRLPPPTPGWTRITSQAHAPLAVWVPREQTTPVQAVLDLLAAVQSAPDAPTWLGVLPDDPVGHAVGAALRCLAAERRPPHVAVAHVLLRSSPGELRLPSLPGSSMTLRQGSSGLERLHWTPVRAPLPSPAERPRTILATGGLRGILVPILSALRPERVLVLGRSPAPTVQAELEHLQDRVPGARYASADVTDKRAVRQALSTLDAPPDLVLHGAAVLRDRRGPDLTPDDVRAVFSPKVQGARVLRQVLPDTPLALLSSLAAHAASPGQAAYAAANAIAEDLAEHVLALTAWDGPGLADSDAVRAALRARGVVPLPPDVGADAVDRALALGGTSLITTAPVSPGFAWPVHHVQDTASGWEAHLRLHPEQRALADHAVRGRPLVPAAVWLDLALHTPGRVEDFEVLAPVFVDHPRSDVRFDLDEEQVAVRAAERVVARARRRPAGPRPAPRDPPAPSAPAEPLYRPDLLFHGPRWRTLDQIGGDGNGTITGLLHTPDPSEPGADLAGLLDGAHQLLALWAAHHLGWTGLPVGARAWSRFDGELPRHLAAWPRRGDSPDEVVADVLAWGEHGVVLHGEQVRLRRAGPVSETVRHALARVLPGGSGD